MDAETVRRLEAVNARFYESHAASFDRARQTPWPGWARVIASLSGPTRVLDAGCGAGRFRAYLAAENIAVSRYVGLDRSEGLLSLGRARFPDAEWRRTDLAGALDAETFDLVVAFGVLHHIPCETRRRELLQNLARRVAPGGRLVVTVWQFGYDMRLEKRILPWPDYNAVAPETINVDQLEPGDVIIRWQDTGYRYCHQASSEEVHHWVDTVGIPLARDEIADSRNRYLTFERPRPKAAAE